MSISRTRSTATRTGHAIGACQKCGAGIRKPADATIGLGVTCECGTRVRLEYVLGNKSDVPCDGRCMGAVGPACSCSCGGENHGKWFSDVEYVATWAVDEQTKAQSARGKRQANHASKRQAKLDALAAARETLLAETPELAALLTDEYATYGRYGSDFADSLRAGIDAGQLSERQIEAGRRMVIRNREREARDAQRAAEQAAAVAAGVKVPAGRYTFTGTITRVIVRDGWGDRDEYRMCVRHVDGWEVWGTVPRDLQSAAMTGDMYTQACDRNLSPRTRILEGRAVTLTAELVPGKSSDLTGNYKRPTGVALVEAVTGDMSEAPTKKARTARTAPAPAPAPAQPVADTPPVESAPIPAEIRIGMRETARAAIQGQDGYAALGWVLTGDVDAPPVIHGPNGTAMLGTVGDTPPAYEVTAHAPNGERIASWITPDLQLAFLYGAAVTRGPEATAEPVAAPTSAATWADAARAHGDAG